MSMANTLSAVSMITIVTNQFANEADEDFAETIANMRRELAPTTIMESVWVEMALLAVKRLRFSAIDETDDSATDPRWLRFQSMAERSLNNAMNRLDKGRRLAARAAASEASPPKPRPASTAKPGATAAVHEAKPPAPPEPPAALVVATVETPEQFARVQQAASETSTLEELMGAIDPAARAEFIEQFRDDVKDMLSEGFEPEEIVKGFPALTLDDVHAFQTGSALLAASAGLAN